MPSPIWDGASRNRTVPAPHGTIASCYTRADRLSLIPTTEDSLMCGIVGYIGKQDATPIIIDGLGRLEYRGYDSAGVAVIHDGCIKLRRDVGKLSNLRAK